MTTIHKPTRKSRPWTAAEDAILRRLALSTMPVTLHDIASELRRLCCETKKRLLKLRLPIPQRSRRDHADAGHQLRGGIDERQAADEALRARCRQLAREMPLGSASWPQLDHEGWQRPYVEALVAEGSRWLTMDLLGVSLTDGGRAELLGGSS